MTQNEMVGVTKWAVDIADKYKVAVTDVTDIFKAIYKYNRDIEKTKDMIIKGIHAR